MNIQIPNEPDYEDDDLDDSGDPTEPSPPPITPEALTNAVTQGLRQAIPPTPPPQMTREQMNQLLSRPIVNEDLIKSMLGEMEDYTGPMKGLNAFVDQISTHAQKTSEAYFRLAMQEFEQRLSPMQFEHEQRVHRTFVRDIIKQYPSLKDKPKFLDATIKQMQSEGYSPKDRAEAIQVVAQRAASLIGQASPGFDLKQQQDQQMPPLGDSYNGSGAASFQRQSRPTRASGVEVFD